ncbi:lipid kinase [Planktothrix sp. FACHB-1355]|uniref:Lipid kinase n=1 Tax=Aerosakkonema funiforme FACHB-1375 TaxID=2949571 RepID=A0A926VDG2_9CYAN|nr:MULTISPECIES: lipid kinase [Oscillatoriales]MBD2180524.1 lipid kinase [Aerosakkonema funiforme FACHB-1375]MBD3561804.1 lipid kinase [Planktothrix sp. FACHB-1355]
MNRRALLLVNRHSRRGQQNLSQAIEQLQALGFQLFEESTEQPKHLPKLIHKYCDRVDLAIVGGGDGTLNAAADALLETQLPLGILPLGTANDLARTLGIPPNLPEACQIIADGHIQRIDLGWVNGKHFFNVASLGLSVKITEQLTKEVKQRWGKLAYAATASQAIWQARPFWAHIRQGDETIRVKTVQIAVGNGRYYGGGMLVRDDAKIDDQRLDLYSLEIQHWWQLLLQLLALSLGQHPQWLGVRTLEGEEFEVITVKPRPINTDGELTTYTPAKFRLIPQALPVFVPTSPEIPGLTE